MANVIDRKVRVPGLSVEASIGTGLAVGALVYTIYGRHLPSGADQRVVDQGDVDAEAARKQALWTSAAVVAGISLIARDPTVFIIGGAMTVGLDWATRANVWTNPVTGSVRDLFREDMAVPTQQAEDEAYGTPVEVAYP